MLKKNIYLAIITAAAYLIQITFLHYFEIGGVIPNLMVTLVICTALTESTLMRAAVYGAICGMALDFSAETIFGINLLLCMYLALLCNFLAQKLFKGRFIVNVLLVLVMSFAYEAAYYALSFITDESVNIWQNLVAVALPTAVYNAILATGMIFAVKRLMAVEQQ